VSENRLFLVENGRKLLKNGRFWTVFGLLFASFSRFGEE
jgi:hypothetical protein